MSKKRRHEEHEEHVDESWLVPYADILTLLLALFIVLYSASSVDVKKFEELSQAFNIAFNGGKGVLEMPSAIDRGTNLDQTRGGKDDDNKQGSAQDSTQDQEEITQEQLNQMIEQAEADLSELKEQLDEYIESNGLSTSLETSLNMSQLLITIRDNALFESAETIVNTEGQKLAVSIANMLEDYPDYNVVISGHTDNTPIRNANFRSNWDLSVMRAVRFMDIMLENTDVDPRRFSATGYGEHHPVASNDTAEGKAKNRRVELSIVSTFLDDNKAQSISLNSQPEE